MTRQNENNGEPLNLRRMLQEALGKTFTTTKPRRRLSPEDQEMEEMVVLTLEAVRLGLMEPLYRPTLAEIFAEAKHLENIKSP
jgi:hypothetical protein